MHKSISSVLLPFRTCNREILRLITIGINRVAGEAKDIQIISASRHCTVDDSAALPYRRHYDGWAAFFLKYSGL